MEKEKQVTNKELSQKLKEFGVPQESLFYWCWNNWCEDDVKIIDKKEYTYEVNRTEYDENYTYYSAFTVAELGEMFGKMKFDGKTMRCVFVPDSKDKNWVYRTYLVYDRDDDSYWIESAGTEADARAKMLIYLIENNLVNVKDIKI